VVSASKSGAVSPIFIIFPPLFVLEKVLPNSEAKVNIGDVVASFRAYHPRRRITPGEMKR